MADKQRSGNENDGLEKELTAPVQEPASEAARRDARRRFMTGGLVGAPMILTLSSKPALATYCSASGMHSGNQSTVSHVTCRGRSPSYWRTNRTRAANYIVPGPLNPLSSGYYGYDDYSIPTIDALRDRRRHLRRNLGYSKYHPQVIELNEYIDLLKDYPNLDSPPFGTQFSEIFASGMSSDPDLTVMQSLWDHEDAPAASHCCAGYLNAAEFGRDEFGYTTSEFVSMVNSRMFSDPIGLLDDLEEMNGRG